MASLSAAIGAYFLSTSKTHDLSTFRTCQADCGFEVSLIRRKVGLEFSFARQTGNNELTINAKKSARPLVYCFPHPPGQDNSPASR